MILLSVIIGAGAHCQGQYSPKSLRPLNSHVFPLVTYWPGRLPNKASRDDKNTELEGGKEGG